MILWMYTVALTSLKLLDASEQIGKRGRTGYTEPCLWWRTVFCARIESVVLRFVGRLFLVRHGCNRIEQPWAHFA